MNTCFSSSDVIGDHEYTAVRIGKAMKQEEFSAFVLLDVRLV
jgi:hypothetical protein